MKTEKINAKVFPGINSSKSLTYEIDSTKLPVKLYMINEKYLGLDSQTVFGTESLE